MHVIYILMRLESIWLHLTFCNVSQGCSLEIFLGTAKEQ